MKTLIAIAGLIILPNITTAQAQDTPIKTSDCTKIQKNGARLFCYDKEFNFQRDRTEDKAVSTGPEPKPETANIGNWHISKNKSKLDDSRTVILTLPSDSDVRDRFGNSKDIFLFLRCQENTTSLIIGFDTFMSDNAGGGYVEYRLDKDKQSHVMMRESTNNQSLGVWTGGKSIPLIKKMFNKKLFTVRATPFSENPITAEFNITGIENAIKPLAEACNWKP